MHLIDTVSSKQYQISISFYEKKPKKSWFTKEDDGCWEEWNITIEITRATSEKEQIIAKTNLSRALFSNLIHITTEAGNKRDHIPPILNSDPFPYTITIHNPENSSWTSMLTNLMP